MTKQLLISLLTVAVSSQAQVAIPNASFENWTTGSTFNPNVPVGWKAYSVSSGAVKTTDAYTGTYALKLNLSPNASPPDISTGFTFPATTASMYFSYRAKVRLSGNDRLIVSADFFNKATGYNYAYINSNNYTYPTQNTTVWTAFSYTMGGDLTTPVDSVRIRFSFTSGSDTANHVYIDDLQFSNTPVGINENNFELTGVSIYPNPAKELLHVQLNMLNNSPTPSENNSPTSVSITNMLGEEILTSTELYNEFSLNTAALQSGIYFITHKNKGKSTTQKIIIE